MENVSRLPRRTKRAIVWLVLLAALADVDANGSCGCDDFAPRTAALVAVSR